MHRFQYKLVSWPTLLQHSCHTLEKSNPWRKPEIALFLGTGKNPPMHTQFLSCSVKIQRSIKLLLLHYIKNHNSQCVIFTVAMCILVLSSFYFIQLMHNYIFQENFKIYIKSAPICFSVNNHHHRAWHLRFAEVIIIKRVSWNTSLKDVLAMWLHIISKLFHYRLGIICSHISEISINDMFQLTILTFITLAKHKHHAPWWWLFKPKHVGALSMLIIM
jgi:hypothetical protein